MSFEEWLRVNIGGADELSKNWMGNEKEKMSTYYEGFRDAMTLAYNRWKKSVKRVAGNV